MTIKRTKKKHPLTKAQSHLLRASLRDLLGTGLIKETPKPQGETPQIDLKDALNAMILNGK